MSGIRLFAVVVPVRDEAERLAACLSALERAARGLRRAHLGRPGPVAPRVRLVVVLDDCADDSARIAHAQPGVEVVVSTAGRVGAARAAGVEQVLQSESLAPQEIWLATTDADSAVPPGWLSHQRDVAHSGALIFRGLVQPDRRECGPAAYDAWSHAYQREPGHPHVHGANLGLRADAYLACGGFDPLAAADEDVALIRRARHLGLPVMASASAVVTTSGRLVGRVGEHSFANYLAARAG